MTRPFHCGRRHGGATFGRLKKKSPTCPPLPGHNSPSLSAGMTHHVPVPPGRHTTPILEHFEKRNRARPLGRRRRRPLRTPPPLAKPASHRRFNRNRPPGRWPWQPVGRGNRPPAATTRRPASTRRRVVRSTFYRTPVAAGLLVFRRSSREAGRRRAAPAPATPHPRRRQVAGGRARLYNTAQLASPRPRQLRLYSHGGA